MNMKNDFEKEIKKAEEAKAINAKEEAIKRFRERIEAFRNKVKERNHRK